MTISEHISLKEYTTFKIGGYARYFVVVTSEDELKEAVVYARDTDLPIFVLGGGSNVLISDEGFPGLVIKLEIKGITFKPVAGERVEVVVGAGENWDELVEQTVAQGLHGLENLSLIPGSVGAAPVQNIGAYGIEVKDSISRVTVFNTEALDFEVLEHNQCDFGYRDSIFKKSEGRKYIITAVVFVLKENNILNISYKDIAEYIKTHNIENITLQKVRDIVIDIRTKKLPDVKIVGTAGSFFKNPIIKKEHYEELIKTYPALPAYAGPSAGTVKIPAAWMLDNLCGFKGYREGEVGVYKNQALVLVNFGNAQASEIYSLAEKMIACVKEKTTIELQKEVNIVGKI